MPREGVTPFPRKGSRFYWCHVPRGRRLGAGKQRSLSTIDLTRAEKLCTWLQECKDDDQVYLLDQLADGHASIPDAYQAYTESRLPKFIDDLRNPKPAAAPAVNLEPFIAGWQRDLEHGKRAGKGMRTKYEVQLRRLIPGATEATKDEAEKPAPPFPISRWTPETIHDWLLDLSASGITATNRFRAAAASFGTYLKGKKITQSIPTKEVPTVKESKPRTRHLEQDEARAVIAAMSGAAQAWHALAAATAMEGQALRKLTRRDIMALDPEHPDEQEVQAHGEKNDWRDRITVVYARWQWAWTIARAYIETRPPSGPVFAELSEWDMRQALKAALKVAGIEDYTPHDWRHTWAVQALKDEVILNDVATQLGHSDPVMTLRVYGRSRPRAKDFRGKGKK